MVIIRELDLRRIAIFGGSGSGKSYLANELGNILKRKPIQIDDLHHGSNWTELSPNMLIKRVSRRIKKDYWIIDGKHSKVGTQIIENCTLVIFLRIPLIYQFKQLILRSISRAVNVKIGPTTPLPIEIEKSETKENFADALYILTWNAIKFYLEKYYRIRKEISKLSKKPQIVILRSNSQRDHFLVHSEIIKADGFIL